MKQSPAPQSGESSAKALDGTIVGPEPIRSTSLLGTFIATPITDDGALVAIQVHRVPGTVGAVAPIHDDEGWLLAADQGFSCLCPDGTVRAIADVAPDWTRMNDAACDSQGRFWAGTLAYDQRRGGGALYRLDRRGQTELMLDGLTTSNGLGWSPDNRTMYLVDTGPGVIPLSPLIRTRARSPEGRCWSRCRQTSDHRTG